MGSTGQHLQPGETVRDIIIDAYQGDPLDCGTCGWSEPSHPRVAGSEYDAIYGPRPADNPRPDPHDFVPFVPTYRVLDYARVAWTEVYLAVETIATGDVWAGVALVTADRSGYVTHKEMTEDMGPGVDRCPVRILDRLTATTDAYAIEWRARCRARLDRPKVKPGARIRFARALSFTNGDAGDLFQLVSRSSFRRIEPDGYVGSTRYTIGSWRELAHTVEG
jgi:hypothetical protein